MYFRKEIEYVKFDYALDSNELLVLKTRVSLPLSRSMDYFLKMLLFNIFIICSWRGDLTYEISSLEVYPPIS